MDRWPTLPHGPTFLDVHNGPRLLESTHRGTAPVALGLRPHTGWAAMVAVADAGDGIQILIRRRAILLDETLPRQVFHTAAALPPDEAQELVNKVRGDACDAAVSVLEEAVGILGNVSGVGVVAWQPAVPEALHEILASHQLMHAAEGDLYRGALHDGAASVGLPVYPFLPADLLTTAATALGLTPDSVAAEVAALGRRVGPPWQRDQKDATLAAWSVLRLKGTG